MDRLTAGLPLLTLFRLEPGTGGGRKQPGAIYARNRGISDQTGKKDMVTPEELREWAEKAKPFYCGSLHATITPKECERLRKLPDLTSWDGEHNKPVRPPCCAACKEYELVALKLKKEEEAAVSGIVWIGRKVQEDIPVARVSSNKELYFNRRAAEEIAGVGIVKGARVEVGYRQPDGVVALRLAEKDSASAYTVRTGAKGCKGLRVTATNLFAAYPEIAKRLAPIKPVIVGDIVLLHTKEAK